MKLKYYFHIHHEILLEALTEPLKNRIKYIKGTKPEDEIELRLKLIKPVKGKLPSEFIKAEQEREEAYQAWVKANQAWVKANQALYEANQALDKAYQAWVKAFTDNMPALEKLHKVECGCAYDFKKKTIFTEENGLEK